MLQGKLSKSQEYFVYFKTLKVKHWSKRTAVTIGKKFFEVTYRYNGRTRYGISAHTAQKWYRSGQGYGSLAPGWLPL